MDFKFPVLIADIGGTHARFMLIETPSSKPEIAPIIKTAGFPSVEAAIEQEIIAYFGTRPKTIVMALACPIIGETFALTNGNWEVRPQALMKKLDIDHLAVMNDFVAQGLAAVTAHPGDLLKIGGGQIKENHPKIAIGPGTGLGVNIAVRSGGQWCMVPGEGGHMDLGPRTEREMAIWPHLRKQDGRMEAELAISGQGLENIHRAISECDGKTGTKPLRSDEITKNWYENKDASCGEAITMMTCFLARVAGDLAVLTMARGGIYIAGGITKYVLDFIEDPAFRKEFENKVPLTHLLSEIPLYVMQHEQPALQGLARLVTTSGEFNVETAMKRFQPEA